MKKNALQLIFTALILLSSNAYAQKITLGAKGGLSIPNLTGGGTENPLNAGYSSRMGADGGIYAEYHVTKPFSVSVGFEYSSQGGLKNKFQAFPFPPEAIQIFPPPAPKYLYADFKSEAKIDYVLLPVLARYSWKLNKRSPLRIYAALGPFAGFLLSAHQVTSGSSLWYPSETKANPLPLPAQSFDANTNIKDSLNTFNAGICGFVGISYSISRNQSIFIEGGGNYGFMSIQKGTGNGKNKTGAAVVTVGYAYTLQDKHKKRGWR